MPLLETKGAASAQGFGLTLGGAERVFIEDVMSVFLYTGNGSTQTITNGIDLAGKGGLVWVKGRSGSFGTGYHLLQDSSRGFGNSTALSSNATDAQYSSTGIIQSVSSTGFTSGASGLSNASSTDYVSWTFRKQPKFFDVVTYTGTGSARTVAHNLGSVPGCIIVKTLNESRDWFVKHRSYSGANDFQFLETTDAVMTQGGTGYDLWDNQNPTANVFYLGGGSGGFANRVGINYVAYLFAHDAGGFGLSGTDNVISCGSYTGNGSTTGPTVTLNYEPQWVMVKRTDSTSNWFMFDVQRGMPVPIGDTNYVVANTSAAEQNWVSFTGSDRTAVFPTATGFSIGSSAVVLNASGGTYIYIAIRRGPMRVPTSGTSVYTSASRTGTASVIPRFTSNFVVDWALRKSDVTAGGGDWQAGDRLRGGVQVKPNLTEAETAAATLYTFDSMTGYSTLGAVGSDTADRSWMFRRAPGFFDVVCYTGTGANRTVSHNLGVAPELMIVKSRTSGTSYWPVYSISLGNQGALALNETGTNKGPSGSFWNSTSPTATTFALGSFTQGNANTESFVAYLFATCPGVSKVGSYTGTGATLQINCGFTGGARFVLIKRTDSTGDWYVWDTARGIVASTDPYLVLNSTAAEVTSTDWVDTYSAGFELSSAAGNNVNINAASYIFLSIA